jgi:hypothetical protein
MERSEIGDALDVWIWRIHGMQTTALIRTITIAIMLVLSSLYAHHQSQTRDGKEQL